MISVSARVAEAVRYAEQLHAGQFRKGTTIPYFDHLVGTMEHAARHGGSDTVLMAAVLHDAIEDQGRDGQTALEIERRFGAEVLALVKSCTNTYPTKLAYAEHLKDLSRDAALVAASDKLYNACSIIADGPGVFARFKGSKAEVKAYYRAVATSLKPLVPPALAQELEAAVTTLETL